MLIPVMVPPSYRGNLGMADNPLCFPMAKSSFSSIAGITAIIVASCPQSHNLENQLQYIYKF